VDANKTREYKWYAVYTKSRTEKKVAGLLLREKIEVYLPLKKTLKQWSDRKKWVEEPLIRAYVFIKISEKEYYTALNTPGVLKYVTFDGKAAPIAEWQIIALQKVIEGIDDYELSSEVFKKGNKVKITSGSMAGVIGEIVETRGNKKFIIRIEHIGYSILLNLHKETSIIKVKE
jgi:transcriptional antiterminator RfaH